MGCTSFMMVQTLVLAPRYPHTHKCPILDARTKRGRHTNWSQNDERRVKGRVDYKEVAQRVLTRIDQGAFLTVKSGEAVNTMTIGWLTIGYVWRTPILMVAVRSSRHTFSIIEVSDDFTVSIPSLNMQREIEFCGTKSGRDYDKFKECNLQISESQDVATPIIRVPGIHFE